MKISPKTERLLSRLYDKTENFFSRVDRIMEKLIRGFFWVYLFGMSFIWLIQVWTVFLSIKSHLFDPSSLIWLILIGGGLITLYSYLNNEYVGHTNFWKAWLIITVISYFTMGWGAAIIVLIMMFPTLYALYQLGFNNQFHKLLCLIKKGSIDSLDHAIYKHGLKLPAGSDSIYSWELLRFVITRLHIIPQIFKTEA